jgi:hypothetical protein
VRIGIPELLILSILLGPLLVGLVGLVLYRTTFVRRAKRFGYNSAHSYLRAAPRSDLERRDAVDLAMTGLAICLLGLVFAPLVLIGLVPLFYGGRKLAYASMGLGLVDDGDQPGV